MINSKLLHKSYATILLKSFVFRIGVVFTLVSLYFIVTNIQFYHFTKEISLLFSSKNTKASIVGTEFYSRKTFTTYYIFDEDPNLYVNTTYFKKPLKEGSLINILYNPNNPSHNKAINGKNNPSSIYFLPLVSLLVGCILLLISTSSIVKIHSILKNGRLTKATFIQYRKTDYDGYLETKFEYFDHRKKRHLLTFETNKLKRITDEEEEHLIYNMLKPENALLVDALPLELSQHIKQNF
ncbi:DUF3592 domain-containing protein [Wenyingzhuangia sp. IMCC45574]